MLQLPLHVPGPHGDVPLLAVLPRAARFRGTVLHFHGLHEAKERYRETLVELAGRGFLSVGVDSIGHGERRARDFDQQVGQGFWTILRWVEETAREIPVVLDALGDLVGVERAGPVAVSGVSMGGYVAYAAGVREPRAAAIVSILGSPDRTRGGTLDGEKLGESPHRRPEAFAPRRLLAINCELDDSVPPEAARRFVESLKPHYAAQADALSYVEYPRWGHLLSDDHWKDVWTRTCGWLERHLPARR